ncbi:MAG: type VI secretion system lipoprotein TssJ, partial [Candidatus Eisenbacteria bacterium]
AIPQARLWEADEEELAKDLVYRRELFLNPGTEESCELPANAEARHLMVAGNFCKAEGDCWRWIAPLPEKGKNLKLRFGPTCILEVAGAGTGK